MGHDSNAAANERVVFRSDPETCLQRSYVLSSEEYERMVASGLDPATVDDEKLMRCSIHCCSHDDLGRVVAGV